MLPLRTTFASLLCLASTHLLAQQYTPAKITFANPGPYSQADLQAASGLRLGQPFNKESLQAAAQKLIGTGLFDDVGVVLDGPVAAITVKFSLKPYAKEQLLQTSFENFVWWQPQELLAELHTRVPLFNPSDPSLPESGEEQDAVQAALEHMLAAKSITAQIRHRVIEPSLVQPRRTVAYTVDSPAIRLHSFSFTGVSASQAPTVRKFLPMLTGRPYLEGATPASTTTRVLDLYRNAGYLQAAFSDVHRTITATPTQVDVDLTATLHEGDVFHVAKLDWAGSPIYSSTDFATAAKLHPGDVASRYQLLQTLLPLDRAYRAKGYLDATIDPSPALDPAAHLVSYTIAVSPGEPYHLHSFTPVNLSATQTADFNSFWKLKPGDIYDADYVATFLTGNNAPVSLRGFSAASTVVADPTTHLVDLTITFVKGGSLVTQ